MLAGHAGAWWNRSHYPRGVTHAPEPEPPHDYDVCLSFAGEQRTYVDEVAIELRRSGIRFFYDDFERVSLWGKDLYEHLDWVYRLAARYCVIFISEDYGKKLWTTHERRSAQARAFEASSEYILPTRFDNTRLPGVRPTVGYIDLQVTSPTELADLIRKKLGPIRRQNYFPPEPDLLFAALGAETDDEQEAAVLIGQAFMQALQRMTTAERDLITEVFLEGCTAELPENVHISLDLIRRELGLAPAETLRTLRGLSSVGFSSSTRPSEDDDVDDEMVVVEWHDRTTYDEEAVSCEWSMERSTEVACQIVRMSDNLCQEHIVERVRALDFSALSSATVEGHVH